MTNTHNPSSFHLPTSLQDPLLCQAQLGHLQELLDGRSLRFMEVCGTHTTALFRTGLRSLLPSNITHLTGPGCPVCVTHERDIAAFLALAQKPDVVLATFGDLMRVPDSKGTSLQHAKAQGADIRIVYSPLDALRIAEKEPNKSVVFLGVGFETTAPTVAASIAQAKKEGRNNFFVYACHKGVPEALSALLSDPACRIDAFLLPGHVSTIIGTKPFAFIAEKWKKPAVVAGFHAADMLDALCRIAKQVVSQDFAVENAYLRAVHEGGNPKARALLEEVFYPSDALWRGLGLLPKSGFSLRKEYEDFDAMRKFSLEIPEAKPNPCLCGDILRGALLPPDCPQYGKVCKPQNPLGPCMVSTEGACAAYFAAGY